MFLIAAVAVVMAGGALLRAQEVGAVAMARVEPQLVIIDTDIGDDIDDAFALALALKSPELRILGVTTTFGNTEMRARILDRYLAAVGRRDIPVAAGPAATFRKLKRVVIMGGSVYKGYGLDSAGKPKPPEPEWNINCDPAGAKALFAAGVPIFMMPLDSTQVHLEAQEREAIFSHGSALTDQVTLLYHQWIAGSQWHNTTPTLFDPVAVTYTFRPDLCPAKAMHIEVDGKGLTKPTAGAPNAQVCLQSDEKGFLELLLSRVAGD